MSINNYYHEDEDHPHFDSERKSRILYWLFTIILVLLFSAALMSKCQAQEPENWCEPVSVITSSGEYLYRIEMVTPSPGYSPMEILIWDPKQMGGFPSDGQTITCTLDMTTGAYVPDNSSDAFQAIVRSKNWVRPTRKVVHKS